MQSLDAYSVVYVCVVILISYTIRGSTGFGTAIPLLALVLPMHTVPPVVTLLGLISSFAVVVPNRRYIVWPAIWQVLPYCAVGVIVGLYLFATLSTDTLRIALGAFVLGYGVFSIRSVDRPLQEIQLPRTAITAAAGTVGGCVGAMFGTGGPLLAVYFDVLKLEKHRFRASIAAALLSLGILRTVGYVAVGAVRSETLMLAVLALPFVGAGIYLGNRIHAAASQATFRALVSVVMIASGLLLVLR